MEVINKLRRKYINIWFIGLFCGGLWKNICIIVNFGKVWRYLFRSVGIKVNVYKGGNSIKNRFIVFGVYELKLVF